jgi:hypothetical protein
MGNYHDQFLGEGAAVTRSPLPDTPSGTSVWRKASSLCLKAHPPECKLMQLHFSMLLHGVDLKAAYRQARYTAPIAV